MPEAVRRAQGFESLLRQCHSEILFAHSMDAVSSQSLAALIDKQTVLVKGSGCCAIPGDVTRYQFDGFWQNPDLAIPVSLAKDGKGIVVRVQIVDLQVCDFTCPGA